MSLDEVTLEQAVEDGEIDCTKWPAIIEPLLDRLNHIVYNDFPLPRPYPIINPTLRSQNHDQSDSGHPDDSSTTLPGSSYNASRNLPPVPPFPRASTSPTTSPSNIPDSQPPNAALAASELENDSNDIPEIPVLLQQLLTSIISTLRDAFSTKPPHTVQRLAELVLYPNKHYRTLPAWLRAVDRVVSVSSTADIFPLSDTPPNVNGMVNGDGTEGGGILWPNMNNMATNTTESRNGYDKDALGSDESLGGALLTPIPWLRNLGEGTNGSSSGADDSLEDSTLDGSDRKLEGWDTDDVDDDDMLGEPIDLAADAQAIANIAESHGRSGHNLLVPQREDGGVTQGELMRMEQEAGVVPVPHSASGQSNSAGQISTGSSGRMTGDVGIEMEDDGDNMPPHARGPDVVGTVDMGLVGGQQRQIRISSPPADSTISDAVNDAQNVLEGGEGANKQSNTVTIEPKLTAAAKTNDEGSSSTTGSEGYVDIGTGNDSMQVDSKTNSDETDGDIVLVDVDGAADGEEREKADISGVNRGADAADTTGQ